MQFIQNYIYELKDRSFKMTPRMEDIHNRVIRYLQLMPVDEGN